MTKKDVTNHSKQMEELAHGNWKLSRITTAPCWVSTGDSQHGASKLTKATLNHGMFNLFPACHTLPEPIEKYATLHGAWLTCVETTAPPSRVLRFRKHYVSRIYSGIQPYGQLPTSSGGLDWWVGGLKWLKPPKKTIQVLQTPNKKQTKPTTKAYLRGLRPQTTNCSFRAF